MTIPTVRNCNILAGGGGGGEGGQVQSTLMSQVSVLGPPMGKDENAFQFSLDFTVL